MSCTCDKSINCDPCAFCSPPGVTCLTTCAPVDPCEEKINMDCVIYSGADHPCSNIAHGESISPIMMQALSLIFPIEECCYFEATAVFMDPPQYKYTFCRSYEDGTCERACTCDGTSTPNTILYSLSSTLSVGTALYADQGLSIHAPEGWYSANGNCYIISGGSGNVSIPGLPGVIQSISSCSTTTSTTTTTTLATCYCFTITMLSTHTILYQDCAGVNITSPSYTAGTTVDICAQLVTQNAAYTWVPPIKYCADRVNCPTTTTTTTAAPTTTTTTLPPCNCITFTNNSSQANISWIDCTGTLKSTTISGIDPITGQPSILKKCGSSGSSNTGKVDITVGSACTGVQSDPICPATDTTTVACSQFILQCCKNDTPTPIIIQPCYVNTQVPFAVGNIYQDDQGRYWVVMGTSGTPNNSYIPAFLTFIASNPNGASAALLDCQSRSVNQTVLCPGQTTTQGPPVAYTLAYSNVNCTGACYSTSTSVYYSRCATLASGGTCRLYTDAACTTPAPLGFYSNGLANSCYSVNSSGYIGSISPCSSFVTTTPVVNTTTVNNRYVTVNNQLPTTGIYGTIKITNVGSGFSGGGQVTITRLGGTTTWTSGPATNPGQSSHGTYTLLAALSQIGIGITANSFRIGGLTQNYPVYVHIIVNGAEIDCFQVPNSTTSQNIIQPNAYNYQDNDNIVVNINTTHC